MDPWGFVEEKVYSAIVEDLLDLPENNCCHRCSWTNDFERYVERLNIDLRHYDMRYELQPEYM